MAELGRLGEIVAHKRQEVAARLGQMTLAELRGRAAPTERSLLAATARPGGRFIFEFKRASPSEGQLRGGADPAAIARAYSGAADAMSVLTDERFFGGSLDDLRAVRGVFDGPILAKDFVIDPRQVLEARIAGADAVLAILAVLPDSGARAVIDEAARLGMDVLVEVHDEAEMRRALALGARLIGINNRDLKTFTIDLAVTERLAAMATDRVVIAESGIASRADVDRLAPLVDGFLIGSSVMRSADPREAARELAFGRVKLCGLRTAADLEAAAPACFAGLVFVPGTPRALTLQRAETLIGEAAHHPPLVAVFREAPLADVIAATHLPLAAIQLHGSEHATYIRQLRTHADCEIWTVESDPAERGRGGDRTLFDNGRGGTGQAFDWSRLKGRSDLRSSLIAGGIGPHNARLAMGVAAYAIDVGSAVEDAPGVKSPAKIAALFEALRPVSRVERMAQCA